ncbi:MAG: hypothetical protein PHF00_04980, partial [Elusimicrobia bacterium]|nr:hypothetical protein [Elusimicrobiota bacterium]
VTTAIKLLFDRGDFISINTLGSAAFRVLYDISQKKKHKFHVLFDDLIAPGKERIFWGYFNRVSEFSKHADRNPDDLLKNQDETLNDHLLFFCCVGWLDSGRPLPHAMNLFWHWYIIGHPDIMKPDYPMRNQILAVANNSKSRSVRLEAGKQMLLRYGEPKPGTIRIPSKDKL